MNSFDHPDPLSLRDQPPKHPGDGVHVFNYWQDGEYIASVDLNYKRITISIYPPFAHCTPQSEPDRYIYKPGTQAQLALVHTIAISRCEFARRTLRNEDTLTTIARRNYLESI